MHDLARLFKALSDASWLRILNLLLSTGELCVCDIERVLDATQTKVSRHLAYLKGAGLVSDRRKGFWMLYSIPKTLSSDHRLILATASRTMQSNPKGQHDILQLAIDISKGCCTTFGTIKPKALPPQLKHLKQGKGEQCQTISESKRSKSNMPQ